MSDVNGCNFYVFNASTGPISGTVTHTYSGKPTVSKNFDGINERDMSSMQAFESGTNHTDEWTVSVQIADGSTLTTDAIKCDVKQDNTSIAVVISNWGAEIVPQLDAPKAGEF